MKAYRIVLFDGDSGYFEIVNLSNKEDAKALLGEVKAHFPKRSDSIDFRLDEIDVFDSLDAARSEAVLRSTDYLIDIDSLSPIEDPQPNARG